MTKKCIYCGFIDSHHKRCNLNKLSKREDVELRDKISRTPPKDLKGKIAVNVSNRKVIKP